MHPVVLAGHTLANNNSLPTLAPAQLCNAVLAAQSIEHNPNLVLGRKVPSARPSDIPDHLLGGLLRLRGFRRHSGSFVFQTRPELSLNLKPNSVPRALRPDRFCTAVVDFLRAEHIPEQLLHPVQVLNYEGHVAETIHHLVPPPEQFRSPLPLTCP